MRALLLNLLVVALIAAPLVLLHYLRYRTEWLRKHHDAVSVVVWLATLLVVYAVVLPRLGLVSNPRFFDR